MQLKEVYTPDVACCTRETDAVAAAGLMRQRHVGALVIVDRLHDDRIPIGVITDRDLVVDVLAPGLDPLAISVGTIAKKPVIIANESEDISAVVERMRSHGIRRMPVVNHAGLLVGIVTLDDLLGLMVSEANALVQTTAKGQKQEQHLRR